jgi:hypothetical protein
MRMVALLLLMVAPTGCFRYQTRIPGVVDVRTDGSEAARSGAQPPARAVRTGAQGLLLGRGTERRGDRIHVEDRRYDLRQAIPLVNPSAARELADATGASGALRRVELTEQMTLLDVLYTFLAGYLPLGDWFTPSWTFTASGEPVIPPGKSGGAPPPPLPTAPASPFDSVPGAPAEEGAP